MALLGLCKESFWLMEIIKNKKLVGLFVFSFFIIIYLLFSILFLPLKETKEDVVEENLKKSGEEKPVFPTSSSTTNLAPLLGDEVDEMVADTINPGPISSFSANVRAEIISSSSEDPIFSSSNVFIIYKPEVDLFHAEIISTDIVGARREVYSFFKKRGVDMQEACNMPIVFFRDPKRSNPNLSGGLEFYNCEEYDE